MKLSKKAWHAWLFQFVYGHLNETNIWRYLSKEILAFFLLPIAIFGFYGTKFFHLKSDQSSHLQEGLFLIFLSTTIFSFASILIYFMIELISLLVMPAGFLSFLGFLFFAFWVITTDFWWPVVERWLCPRIVWEE